MRVDDSQASRKMDLTREYISCIQELREILLSFQTGFNLVNVAVLITLWGSSRETIQCNFVWLIIQGQRSDCTSIIISV